MIKAPHEAEVGEPIGVAKKDAATLAEVGFALYGERWQTEMGRALGLTDGRRIRQWMSGDRPIPPWAWTELAVLMRSRRDALDRAIALLQRVGC